MKDQVGRIIPYLPARLARAVESSSFSKCFDEINELRLRAGKPTTVTADGKNLFLSENGGLWERSTRPLVLTADELRECVTRLCGGSVYSYYDSIKNGYITKENFRVGITGKGIVTNGHPDGFSQYTSINIRIPAFFKNSANDLLSYIARYGTENTGGILVISPPGVGKTTLLRSLAYSLSKGYTDGGRFCIKRVCIIDEREEIYSAEFFSDTICDVISSLPKGFCIELCTRVMSPEIIVCDEIGNYDEAERIKNAASKGVLFVASCHGKDVYDVIKKPFIRELFDIGVFSTACVIGFSNGARVCSIKRADEMSHA